MPPFVSANLNPAVGAVAGSALEPDKTTSLLKEPSTVSASTVVADRVSLKTTGAEGAAMFKNASDGNGRPGS